MFCWLNCWDSWVLTHPNHHHIAGSCHMCLRTTKVHLNCFFIVFIFGFILKRIVILSSIQKRFSGLKIILLDVYFVFNIEIHKSFKNTSWFDLTWVEPKKTWSCWLPPCLYVCYHYRECCTTIVQQNIIVKSK